MQPKEQQRSECVKLFCNLSTVHSLFDCKDVLMIIQSYCLSLRFDHIRSQDPGIQLSEQCKISNSFRPGHIRFVNDFRTANGSLLEMPLLMLHAKKQHVAVREQAPQVFVLNLKKDGLLHRLEDKGLFYFNVSEDMPVGDASLNYLVGTTNRLGQWMRVPIPTVPVNEPQSALAEFSNLYNGEVFVSMIINEAKNDVYILSQADRSSLVHVFDLETMQEKLEVRVVNACQCMSIDFQNRVMVIGSTEGIYVYGLGLNEENQWKLRVRCGNVKAICVDGNLIGVIRKLKKSLSVVEFYESKTGSLVAGLNPKERPFKPFGIAFNKSILVISDARSNKLHVFRWDWSCFS